MPNTSNSNKVFGIDLIQSEDGLKLGTDAFLLSAYIKENKKAWGLEMGAGSGVISLLLAARSCFARISAIELQPEMTQIMIKNIENNGFQELISAECADVRKLDNEKYKGVSVVFANPPYMKTDSGKSCPGSIRQTSRHETHGGVYDFCLAASKVLKTGGKLYLVYRPDRLQTLITSLEKTGFCAKRMTLVCSDLKHSPSSVLVEAVLGGKESLYMTKPLLLMENGNESADCKYIYQHGVFPPEFQKN